MAFAGERNIIFAVQITNVFNSNITICEELGDL